MTGFLQVCLCAFAVFFILPGMIVCVVLAARAGQRATAAAAFLIGTFWLFVLAAAAVTL